MSVPGTRVKTLDEIVVPGKRLGRHVEHDERSRAFAVAAEPAEAIGPVSHRRFGMLNQGQLGSCTGNAMAGALNTRPFRVGTATLLKEPDAVRLYSEATRIDGIQGVYPPTDTGSSGLAVGKAAKKEGRIAGYGHAFSVKAALSALMKIPVITGVAWYEGFDNPDLTGLVKIAGQIRGGHEFEVVAFEPVSTNDPLLDGIVEAVNSWGYSYGVRGRFRFTARTWAELLADDGDVTVPTPLAA
jgi:hypothetical protein